MATTEYTAAKLAEKKLSGPTIPPLVVEFHYSDGDVGAYTADGQLGRAAAALWEYFSPRDIPSTGWSKSLPARVVIRPRDPERE